MDSHREPNYWLRKRIPRRTVLLMAGTAGVGAASWMLVGCGSNSGTTAPPASPTPATDEQFAEVMPQLAPEVQDAVRKTGLRELAVLNFLAEAQKNVAFPRTSQRPMQFRGDTYDFGDPVEPLAVQRQVAIVTDYLWDFTRMPSGRDILFVVTSAVAGFNRTAAEPYFAFDKQLLPRIETWLGIPFPYPSHHAQVLMAGEGAFCEGANTSFGAASAPFLQAHERVHLWQTPYSSENVNGAVTARSLPVGLFEAIADLIGWDVTGSDSIGYYLQADLAQQVELNAATRTADQREIGVQAGNCEYWLGDLARALGRPRFNQAISTIMARQPMEGVSICQVFESAIGGNEAVRSINRRWIRHYSDAN